MGRISKDLNYLKNIKPIQEHLRDTPKSEKTIKTYLLSLDRFFPYLANRFNDVIENLKDFDLKGFYELETEAINNLTLNWDKQNINNEIFENWKNLSPEKKSDILMKWVKDCNESKYYNKGNTKKNTFLVYMWTIQGFFSKLGRDYEANPKNLAQLEQNGTKIGSEISYNEVVELYERLNNDKYKIILKIMMYSGLNPIDILALSPKDFIRIDAENNPFKYEIEKDYYYIKKVRTKTQRKSVEFLILLGIEFFNEIKNFFERKIILSVKKSNTEKVKKLRSDKHFIIESESENSIKFSGSYNWNNDKKDKIFGKINSTTVSDAFRYCVDKNGLNPKLQPLHIRRLCFTKLQNLFVYVDKPIYDLWTQHKIKGIVDQFYITNYLERIIENYLERIEDSVLIGDLRVITEKANGYKKKAEKVDKHEKDIQKLELKNNRLLTELNDTNDKLAELTNIIKGLGSFIQEDFRRVSEDITVDYKDKSDSEYFKRQHKVLGNLIKKINKISSN